MQVNKKPIPEESFPDFKSKYVVVHSFGYTMITRGKVVFFSNDLDDAEKAADRYWDENNTRVDKSTLNTYNHYEVYFNLTSK